MSSPKRLIHEIFSSAWLIDPAQAQSYLHQLDRLMTGPIAGEKDDAGDEYKSESLPYLVSISASGARVTYSGLDATVSGDVVAVIPVLGPIMKHDNCGDPGTVSLERWVRQAGNDPKVKGILLETDSPGGTVAGTQTFANTIRDVRAVKPVVGFASEGMIASAAYWINSQCTEIVASTKLDEIGSIGVFTRMMDVNAALSARYDGAKVEDIYSTLSSEKNGEFRKWLAGDKGPTEAALDVIAKEFVSVVKAGRGDRLKTDKEDPFKGASYYATEALNIGLIDHIGPMSFAINRVLQLADEKSAANPSSNANSNHNDTMSKISLVAYPAILSALNISAENATEVEFTAEHLTAINAAMVKTASELTTATSHLATKSTEAVQLTTDLAAANATIATYGKKAGADASNPLKGKEEINAENQTLIDSLPHNQKADEIFPTTK